MNDREQIEQLYHDMYRAMVNKNRTDLECVHDDSFALRHMTGMVQDKETYIHSIMNGTLNYYSEQTDELDIQIHGDTATMTGRSQVTAAVFGGGKHTWRLQLKFDLIRRADGWKLTSAAASTY